MYATTIAIVNAIMKLFDDDRDAEKMVYDTLNEYVGDTGEKHIRGGVLGVLDIDISGSLAMGPGAIPTDLWDLTGAVGGMAEDMFKGGKFVLSGEYGKAAEKILPKAVGNILTAIREMREGATTRNGYRIWDEEGNPYMPTGSETFKRGLGFRSARRAQLAQTTWVSKREENRFEETMTDIYRKLRSLATRPKDEKLRKDIADEISKYNINAMKTANIALITPASIERMFKRMGMPTKKERMRVTRGVRSLRYDGDVWAAALGLTRKPDTTQAEVKRLSDSGLLSYPTDQSQKINLGYGKKITLTQDQYDRHLQDTSKLIKIKSEEIINSRKYAKYTDKQKAFILKRVTNKCRKMVRDRLKASIFRSMVRK